jgi:hypothetical protein
LVELYATRRSGNDTCNGFHAGAFTCTVSSQQCQSFTKVNLQFQAKQNLTAAVKDI